MLLFNSGVIYHLIKHHRDVANENFRFQHRSITITLVVTTFFFLIMTVPSTIAFAFFSSANPTLLNALDGMLYAYHTTSFLLYLITFTKFRREVFTLIQCKRNNGRVGPMNR